MPSLLRVRGSRAPTALLPKRLLGIPELGKFLRALHPAGVPGPHRIPSGVSTGFVLGIRPESSTPCRSLWRGKVGPTVGGSPLLASAALHGDHFIKRQAHPCSERVK